MCEKGEDAGKAKGAYRELKFVLGVFAASRLFYLTVGTWLAGVVPVAPVEGATSGMLDVWSRWDGKHYANLAAGGYLQPPGNVSPAFFPLYPLLMRLLAEPFGGPVSPEEVALSGVLISLLALPFAFYFIYRIAEDGWGVRVAQGAVLSLAFFPTSFYLNAAYSESLFIALSAGSLWAVRVRRNLLWLACLRGSRAPHETSVSSYSCHCVGSGSWGPTVTVGGGRTWRSSLRGSSRTWPTCGIQAQAC